MILLAFDSQLVFSHHSTPTHPAEFPEANVKIVQMRQSSTKKKKSFSRAAQKIKKAAQNQESGIDTV